jgi:SOS response regulatory protein OraA/RecX
VLVLRGVELCVVGEKTNSHTQIRKRLTATPMIRNICKFIIATLQDFFFLDGATGADAYLKMEFINEGCARNAADPKKLLTRLCR